MTQARLFHAEHRHLPYVLPPTGYKLPTQFPDWDAADVVIDCEMHDPHIKKGLVDDDGNDQIVGQGARRGSYIIGYGIRFGDFAEYYPTRHAEGPNLDPEPVQRYLRAQALRFKGRLIGANQILYDGDFLQMENIRFPTAKWRDVQWAEPLLDEFAKSYSLEALAQKYLGEGKAVESLAPYGPMDLVKQSMREVHPGHMRDYVLGDLDRPARVLVEQEKELRKHGLLKLYDLESRLAPLLLYMRETGVPINLEKAAKIQKDLAAGLTEHVHKMNEEAGMEVDYNSSESIARACDRLGIAYEMTDPTPSYPNGQPSFTKPAALSTEKWIERQTHPMLREMYTARFLDKLKTTFVEGYLLNGHINGRLHGDFHPLRRETEGGMRGTVGGRFSSSNPNLQNIPIRSAYGKLIRECFEPEFGMEWGTSDYCVSPQTRILTSDLRWVAAKTVKVGDTLVGFDKDATRQGKYRFFRRRYRITKVVAVKNLLAECVLVNTNRTAIICSTTHGWLAKGGGRRVGANGTQNFTWVEAAKLRPGYEIPRMCFPWETDQSWEAGYIAAAFDGEGHLTRTKTPSGAILTMAQRKNAMLSTCEQILREKNFVVPRLYPNKGDCFTLPIRGGRHEQMRFLGSFRPPRLLAKANKLWEGRICASTLEHDVVTGVEYLGRQQVTAIQTDCGTIIAEGLLSSNSQIEYRLLVHFAVQAKARGAQIAQRMYREDPTTDFHNLAVKLTGLPRPNAKNVNFGIIFGMGPEALAATLGLSLPDTLNVLEQYHSKMPYVKPTTEGIIQFARKNGYTKTLLGRRCRFEEEEDVYGKVSYVFTHKAPNRKIQGSAADLFKKAAVDIWEGGLVGPDFPMYLLVHDEFDIGKPYGDDTKFARMKEIMQDAIHLEVPVLAECSTGENWGDAK